MVYKRIKNLLALLHLLAVPNKLRIVEYKSIQPFGLTSDISQFKVASSLTQIHSLRTTGIPLSKSITFYFQFCYGQKTPLSNNNKHL